jgi:hypothetical protein
MASRYIHEIQGLADRFRPNERNLTLYFPDFDSPAAEGFSRVFGPPVGLRPMDWPIVPHLHELLVESEDRWDPNDLRMEHVFTIDLAGTHLLGVPPGARAMMLFISNANYHRAFSWNNSDSAVIFLSEDEVARGMYRGPIPERSLRRWSRRFVLAPIDVPGDVFDADSQDDPVIAELHEAIWQAPARFGGRPIWVRREPSGSHRVTFGAPTPSLPPRPPVGLPAAPEFVMQFERRFAEVNLGNQGVMYVTGTSACYQSF